MSDHSKYFGRSLEPLEPGTRVLIVTCPLLVDQILSLQFPDKLEKKRKRFVQLVVENKQYMIKAGIVHRFGKKTSENLGLYSVRVRHKHLIQKSEFNRSEVLQHFVGLEKSQRKLSGFYSEEELENFVFTLEIANICRRKKHAERKYLVLVDSEQTRLLLKGFQKLVYVSYKLGYSSFRNDLDM